MEVEMRLEARRMNKMNSAMTYWMNQSWRHRRSVNGSIKRYVVLLNILGVFFIFLQLVKARDLERKKAIAEGKMDDPLVPKHLEDAITMIGTCMDMCPRFERYRRERE